MSAFPAASASFRSLAANRGLRLGNRDCGLVRLSRRAAVVFAFAARISSFVTISFAEVVRLIALNWSN